MRKSGKTRAPVSFLATLVIIFSLFLCLGGFLIVFVICVDRVSEFSNGLTYQNDWTPLKGNFIDYLQQLPGALYTCIVFLPQNSFAAFVLLPLAVFIVPVYDAIFLNSYALLLNGVLPFAVGVGGGLWSVYLLDTHRVPKIDPPDFDNY